MPSKPSKSKHHKQQMAYFDDEFTRLAGYRIEPWMQSYIDRIDKFMRTDTTKKSETILDVAAGTGYVSIAMAERGLTAIATDLSDAAINNLKAIKKRNKIAKLRIIKCYAEDIPLPDKSVDFIVANAILEHIPAEKKTIKEWKRLLKPGGKILVTVPLEFKYLWPFFWPVNYIHDQRIGHLRRYNKEILEKKFGMSATHVFYTGHLLKVLYAVLAVFIKNDTLAHIAEQVDQAFSHMPYGASNISVIMQK